MAETFKQAVNATKEPQSLPPPALFPACFTANCKASPSCHTRCPYPAPEKFSKERLIHKRTRLYFAGLAGLLFIVSPPRPSLGKENLPSCLRDTKAPHTATHVATGSKTWSIQFVCFLMFAQESRSFSGLLGLLAAAFGTRGGPTSSGACLGTLKTVSRTPKPTICPKPEHAQVLRWDFGWETLRLGQLLG